MATAVHMQPSTSRPTIDRTPSFDQPRSRSTPPFSHHNRSPSPNVPPQHSRTSSNVSASSPYQQPFANSYLPQQGLMHGFQPPPNQGAWTTAAIPANNFYPSPMQLHPGQSFQQGFQQSQADFAAWATAYHQYVAANMAKGTGHSGQIGHGAPTQTDFYGGGERRRTASGPSAPTSVGQGHEHSHVSSQGDVPRQFPQHSPAQQNASTQGFHPYKRAPSHRTSRENIGSGGSVSASTSISTLSSLDTRHSPSNSISKATSPQNSHRRTASFDSGGPRLSVVPPPRVASKQDTYNSEHDRAGTSTSTTSAVPQASQAIASTKPGPPAAKTSLPASSSQDRPKPSQPLHTGPIANATNTPQAVPSSRPSPLSQATLPSPEKTKSGGGLRNRLRRALDQDATTPKKQTNTPASAYKASPYTSKPTFASPSETSTRSATPPMTPPQGSDLPPPSAPFAVAHQQGMGSDISLAETERTATAPSEMGTGKQKKSLFRMKNMSTDNISLSSTVSSASMMIRKMGSLGKLARRNSLMGISKIFKEKPKDDDAPLPQKEGKRSKKQAKKDQAKGLVAPAAVSHATAEPDRFSEDDDRILAGLSPAAKLARQHTLRSRAEQEKRNKQNGKTGEPAWENNTATRQNNAGVLPSISTVAGANVTQGAPEVLHITPSRTSTTVHAVQVEDHDYDSDDDSSDGETVEDVTAQLGKTRLSDSSAADREFRETWQSVWIDRNAVPKKGILKSVVSLENMAALAARQRSNSSAQSTNTQPGPMAQPQGDAHQVDGVQPKATQSSPRVTLGGEEVIGDDNSKYDPFSASFAPFESPTVSAELHFPYSTPAHNTSMPTLSLANPGGKPIATRSMTAPAKRRLIWAPECSVYSTYDAMTYDRRSEPATCNRLTPELAMMIKQELNAFKMEMLVHPESRGHTHFFA